MNRHPPPVRSFPPPFPFVSRGTDFFYLISSCSFLPHLPGRECPPFSLFSRRRGHPRLKQHNCLLFLVMVLPSPSFLLMIGLLLFLIPASTECSVPPTPSLFLTRIIEITSYFFEQSHFCRGRTRSLSSFLFNWVPIRISPDTLNKRIVFLPLPLLLPALPV